MTRPPHEWNSTDIALYIMGRLEMPDEKLIRETPDGLAFVRPGSHPDWPVKHIGTTTTQDYAGPGEPTVPEKAKSASVGDCRRCGAAMSDGIALSQTYTGSPDDLGGEVVTLSPGGPGRVVLCRKCTECGWSMPGVAQQSDMGIPISEQEQSLTQTLEAAPKVTGAPKVAAPQEAEPVAWRWRFGDSPWCYGDTLPRFSGRYGSETSEPDAIEALGLAQPAPAPAVPVSFGLGQFCIDTGEYNGLPAVFIAPARFPGEVGASAKREGHPLDALVHGERVLTFPTIEQAKRVADALCNAQPAPQVNAPQLSFLRPIWRQHGGDWHGPRVEKWTIPEKNMVAFVAALLAALSGEAQR